MKQMRPLALLTDFGLADPYAGQLRAALARQAPGASLLDISHSVEPFAVSQAAFFLAASAPHFPSTAVFVCVVDPGVGSTRRIVGVHLPTPKGGQDFLAPDNGLLGLLLTTPGLARPRVFDLAEAAVRYEASATFHGRDVFAPLAARLSSGEVLEGLGRELDAAELVRPDWSEPRIRPEAPYELDVHVLHVDRYGNCLLSLRSSSPPPRPVTTLKMPWGQRRDVRMAKTYAELPLGAVGLMAGSQGFYELASNQASAAQALGLRRGDALRLAWTE
ncbi:MAG: SAM-dependent chlorinase/fluorinase [Humidesulfovibrio sp.]|nr:SAM-dependent chlorinase/fluorinase [Humidesulfovibrio sp.]